MSEIESMKKMKLFRNGFIIWCILLWVIIPLILFYRRETFAGIFTAVFSAIGFPVAYTTVGRATRCPKCGRLWAMLATGSEKPIDNSAYYEAKYQCEYCKYTEWRKISHD